MCRLCGGRHSTLLLVDAKNVMSKKDSSKLDEQITNSTSEVNEERSASSSFSGTTQSDMRVVLATAVVRVCDNKGNYVLIRILLDSGSQVSAMTTECV